jgi:hypothetical protein
MHYLSRMATPIMAASQVVKMPVRLIGQLQMG